MQVSTVGPLVRDWRHRRRRSQMDLALEVGVSCRHLSYVETGRSRPSPELVLAIAEHLEIPLRERNHLLLAAGYAPRYSERPLDHESMAAVRGSIQRLLDAHDPYPGVALDRQWNLVLTNSAAITLLVDVPAPLLDPPINVYRLGLHPEGLWSRSTNPHEWGAFLMWQLRRALALSADPALAALLDEVSAYPTVAALSTARAGFDEPPLLVPFRFTTPLGELSLFTTITTFGTPRDVTLDEIAIELFFPADAASEAMLRAATPDTTP